MKVAFYFNDLGFENMDLSDPYSGNNGIGGTQYCFLMIGKSLIEYTNISVSFYHYHNNILPHGINDKIITNSSDIIESFEEDILIFKAEGCSDFEKSLINVKFDCIAWAHNYLLSDELDYLYKNEQIKRVVFVSHEQYDRYIDHPIIEKSEFIYNMFDYSKFKFRDFPQKPVVTYTGSLVYSKGFHILASVWKKILKKVPNAELYVIGSGNLYNRNSKFGKYNIADEKYEAQFIPYLLNKGKILSSVHFLGTLGKEKIDIYNKTTVGVMNPSGRTETFGLSAIEMEACGIPVVTKASNGLLNTSINGKTGYLIKNKRQLVKKISYLLKSSEKNKEMGANGREFVKKFEPKLIVRKWEVMFNDVLSDKKPIYIRPSHNFTNNFKWLRILNVFLKKKGISIVPLVDIECKLKKILGK